jgi:hypothetical protein
MYVPANKVQVLLLCWCCVHYEHNINTATVGISWPYTAVVVKAATCLPFTIPLEQQLGRVCPDQDLGID